MQQVSQNSLIFNVLKHLVNEKVKNVNRILLMILLFYHFSILTDQIVHYQPVTLKPNILQHLFDYLFVINAG